MKGRRKRTAKKRSVVHKDWANKFNQKAEIQKQQETQKLDTEQLIREYKPTVEGLEKGILVSHHIGNDELSVMYAVCFLYDHAKQYENVTELKDALYDVSLEYAFRKKNGKLKLTKTEKKFYSENPAYRKLMTNEIRHQNLVQYFILKELKE